MPKPVKLFTILSEKSYNLLVCCKMDIAEHLFKMYEINRGVPFSWLFNDDAQDRNLVYAWSG